MNRPSSCDGTGFALRAQVKKVLLRRLKAAGLWTDRGTIDPLTDADAAQTVVSELARQRPVHYRSLLRAIDNYYAEDGLDGLLAERGGPALVCVEVLIACGYEPDWMYNVVVYVA
jgi:hypothetical protein